MRAPWPVPRRRPRTRPRRPAPWRRAWRRSAVPATSCSSSVTSVPARRCSPRASPPRSVSPGPVTSPTFALVRQYRCGPDSAVRTLIHADVYRTGSVAEVADLALAELVEEDAVAVVEWGELAAPAMGESALEVTIVAPDPVGTPEARAVSVVGRGRGRAGRTRSRRRSLSELAPSSGRRRVDGRRCAGATRRGGDRDGHRDGRRGGAGAGRRRGGVRPDRAPSSRRDAHAGARARVGPGRRRAAGPAG